MTEAEWLTCVEPQRMLELLRHSVWERKLRLFAVACCRRNWHRITVEAIKEAIQVAERYADDRFIPLHDLRKAWTEISGAYFTEAIVLEDAWETASKVSAGWQRICNSRNTQGIAQPEPNAQCQLLRDIFGNPFQVQVISSSWLASADGTIPRIAEAVYEMRAFEQLPILADALEDLGCDNADILNHCRSSGPHVRGCWVLDLLLEKE